MTDINNTPELNEEEFDDVVIMTDDEGNEFLYDIAARIEKNDNEYVVLLPTEDDDGEVVILQVMDDEAAEEDDEVTYMSVDDDDVLQAVFNLFKEQAGDEFDFEE